MNHADRLALFTSNKLSEMFSTWTKAWKRLSNTQADQIIAPCIIFYIFHKGIACTFACNNPNTLLTKIFGIFTSESNQESCLMGQEWIFSHSFCPARLAGDCRSCRAANTAVVPPVLCPSASYKAPNGFVPLCAALVLQMDCRAMWQLRVQEYRQHSLLEWPQHSFATSKGQH